MRIGQVLQRTAATFTIVRAAWGDAISAGCRDLDDARAVAVDFRGDDFAGQGQRREDLLSIVRGDAIALRAQAIDG